MYSTKEVNTQTERKTITPKKETHKDIMKQKTKLTSYRCVSNRTWQTQPTVGWLPRCLYYSAERAMGGYCFGIVNPIIWQTVDSCALDCRLHLQQYRVALALMSFDEYACEGLIG